MWDSLRQRTIRNAAAITAKITTVLESTTRGLHDRLEKSGGSGSSDGFSSSSESSSGSSGTESSSSGSGEPTASGCGKVTISIDRDLAQSFLDVMERVKDGTESHRDAFSELPIHHVQFLVSEAIKKEAV